MNFVNFCLSPIRVQRVQAVVFGFSSFWFLASGNSRSCNML